MFKSIMVVLFVALMVGCAGSGFSLDNPFVESVLARCQDVPVTEFEECVTSGIDAEEGLDGVTVGDLVELLNSVQPEDAE